MTMRHRMTVPCAALLIAMFGCTNGSEPKTTLDQTATNSTSTASDLEGTWGDSEQTGSLPWIKVHADGRFDGWDGCNHVGGTWELKPVTSTVITELKGSTEAACGGTDQAKFDEMQLGGGTLTYRTAEGAVLGLNKSE